MSSPRNQRSILRFIICNHRRHYCNPLHTDQYQQATTHFLRLTTFSTSIPRQTQQPSPSKPPTHPNKTCPIPTTPLPPLHPSTPSPILVLNAKPPPPPSRPPLPTSKTPPTKPPKKINAAATPPPPPASASRRSNANKLSSVPPKT